MFDQLGVPHMANYAIVYWPMGNPLATYCVYNLGTIDLGMNQNHFRAVLNAGCRISITLRGANENNYT